MSHFFSEMERCIPSLRRYAVALLRERDKADDLVQDCLERAIRKRFLWRRAGSMRGWLFTMMHNIHISQVRKSGCQPNTVEFEEVANDIHAEAGMGQGGWTRDIAFCLEQLPEQQRQVILLVALEGFSYGEASKLLQVPQGTVMSRLSRAREQLRKMMEGDVMPKLKMVK
jgi:RNA polymerase sigma-70 factor (ECF subfamily)